jgi:hypothetical protein
MEFVRLPDSGATATSCRHSMATARCILPARGGDMLQQSNHTGARNLEWSCEAISPMAEPCNSAATSHCGICGRCFAPSMPRMRPGTSASSSRARKGAKDSFRLRESPAHSDAFWKLRGRGQAALRGRLYVQPNSVSCAAMICQLPFRFSQVSVQIRHRVLAVPSFALRSERSVP